ncbi:ComEC/Rec2 family competence protein [Nonomuraea sp. NPDC003201]
MARSACLEIHQLNVGQGDAVLVINRDVQKVGDRLERASRADPTLQVPDDPIDYVPCAIKNEMDLSGTVRHALLIDGGDDEYGGDVLAYLEAHGVVHETNAYCAALSILVSHYHDDHMAGLRSVFKKKAKQNGRRAKGRRATPELESRYRPAAVYQARCEGKAIPISDRYKYFQQDVEEARLAAQDRTKVHYISQGGLNDQGAPAVIELGTGVDSIPINAYVLAAAQGVYDPLAGKTLEIKSVGSVVDQNDRSIVVMIEYGSFRYFAGGDIAGNGGLAGGNTGPNEMTRDGKRYFASHADVESVLIPVMERRFPATTVYKARQPKYPSAGYCTVMKANHHGSSSSVDVHLLAMLRPRVVLISSGVKSRFHKHPTREVMSRLATRLWTSIHNEAVPNTVAQVYLTEMADTVSGKNFPTPLGAGLILGDIVVRPVDETVSAVHRSTARGTLLEVQVYGTGDQTRLLDPGTVLRPTVRQNTGLNYPIGPFTHSDQH